MGQGQAGGPKIPYRLPELLAAPTAVVYFCEGEKDADNLASKAVWSPPVRARVPTRNGRRS